MNWKSSILSIVPPYSTNTPPAGAAALLGYLKAHQCHDFDFVDFRLWVPFSYAPTYNPVGVFGETFVLDVPDLPIVLKVLKAFRERKPLIGEIDTAFENYCLGRGIRSRYLHSYLKSLELFFENVVPAFKHVEFIGFSVWTSNFLTTLIAAAKFKAQNPDIFIVAGGPQVTESENSAKLALMGEVFDAVVPGEGEGPLKDLYEAFRIDGRNRLSKTIPGVLQYDRTANQFPSAERKLLQLPNLPLPSFDEMQLIAYQPSIRAKRILPYQLSRGCTDKCSFCSEWVFWKHFRSDTPDHALHQIQQLQERYGMESIAFTDSLLNGHMGRLRTFAEGLLSKSIKVNWSGFMRAQMDPETAALIKRAGCQGVFLGIESLSNETLELMNKRRTEADNIQAIHTFCDAGISVRAGFIPGFPGDSRNTFVRTGLILRELQRKYPGRIHLNVEPFIVSPGQPISKNLAKFGLEPMRWSEEVLDIDPYFRGITQNIHYAVTGPNQSVDRMGELQIANSLSEDSAEGAPGDPLVYKGQEEISPHRVLFRPAWESWSLGWIKTDTAMTYALIFSSAEKEALERVVSQIKTRHYSTFFSKSLFEWEETSKMLAELEKKHVLYPDHKVPRIFPTKYARKISDESRISLSPFIVARETTSEGSGKLILADFITQRIMRTDPAIRPVIEFIAQSPRTLSEIERLVGDEDLPFEWEELREFLNRMKESGILILDSEGEQLSVDLPVAASM